MEIRALTIPYSKNKQKHLRIKEQDLRNRLDKLDNLLSQSANADDANEKQQEYARLKQELHLLYENKGKGSILRSKTRWTEQGEKPTKYFFNLEKQNYNRKVIKELKRSDGGILFKAEDILLEIENVYRDLYTSNPAEDNCSLFENFVRNLEIPKLQNKERDELGKITFKEFRDVLHTFASGKSPGDDGLTWEFYNCFFTSAGP